MKKLDAVEEARALFQEAKDWSVWRWLTEKRRARQTADAAWEALDALEKQVKGAWSSDLKQAWRELGKRHPSVDGIHATVYAAAKRVKEADETASAAHIQAEETFAEADRRMSAALAREGSQQALDAWDLREKAIRKAEAAAKLKAQS